MKTIKKEFGAHVLTASKLPQTKINLQIFKLTKILLPSASVLLEKSDPEMMYTKLFSLLAHHATVEHFDSLQTLLFSTLLNNDLEPVSDLEEYFDSKNLNSLDVLFWLFKANIAQQFVDSGVFKTLTPMLNTLKSVVGFVDVQPEELTEDEPEPTA